MHIFISQNEKLLSINRKYVTIKRKPVSTRDQKDLTLIIDKEEV